MRTLIVAVLALTLVTGTAIGVTAQEAEPAERSVPATQRCGDIPASEYTGPGYYLYQGGPNYRWCDFRGKWVGPEVDVTYALLATLLVWLGVDTRVFRQLATWVETGDPTTAGEQGPQIDPIPIIAQALIGEEPYQNYRLGWGATSYIMFNGRVTEVSDDVWEFVNEGPPIKGNQPLERTEGATAKCTLKPSPWKFDQWILFDCTVTFGNGEFWHKKEYTQSFPRNEGRDFKIEPKWDTTGLTLQDCHTDPDFVC
jgi:hypothetical protein